MLLVLTGKQYVNKLKVLASVLHVHPLYSLIWVCERFLCFLLNWFCFTNVFLMFMENMYKI